MATINFSVGLWVNTPPVFDEDGNELPPDSPAGSVSANLGVSYTAFLGPNRNGDSTFGTTGATDAIGTGGNDAITAASGGSSIQGLGGNDNLSGAGGNDILDGGAGDDNLLGGGGNDSLTGGDGDDGIDGGANDDTIDGGIGNDGMVGGAGNDTITGGPGNDLIDGDEGNDNIIGGDGDDGIDGGANDDTIDGGAGNDRLAGGEGIDTIDGGDGDDQIAGDAGDDIITDPSGANFIGGGPGSDKITGGSDTDVLGGDEGDDEIHGGGARDYIGDFAGTTTKLYGDGGDDVFGIIGFSSGTIDGGTGTDKLGLVGDVDLEALSLSSLEILETNGYNISATAALFASFNTIWISDGDAGPLIPVEPNLNGQVSLTLKPAGGNTELDLTSKLADNGGRGAFVTGTSDNETITGGATFGNELVGNGGNDTLTGGQASDLLTGGADTDTLDGGGGVDTAFLSGQGSDYTFYVSDPFNPLWNSDGPDGDGDSYESIENYAFDNVVINNDKLLEILMVSGEAEAMAQEFAALLEKEQIIQDFLELSAQAIAAASETATIANAGSQLQAVQTAADLYFGVLSDLPGVAGKLANAWNVGGFIGTVAGYVAYELPTRESAYVELVLKTFGAEISNLLFGGGGKVVSFVTTEWTLIDDAEQLVAFEQAKIEAIAQIAAARDQAQLYISRLVDIREEIALLEWELRDKYNELQGLPNVRLAGESTATPEELAALNAIFLATAADLELSTYDPATETVASFVSTELAEGEVNLVLAGLADTSGSGNELDNSLTGNAGNNSLLGKAGNDSLFGGDGSDLLFGDAGDDTIDGGAGNDTLVGGVGDDALDGGSGSDLLLGTADGDVIDGGSGSDTASYSGSNAGVTVSLAAGTATGGHATGDTLTSIENLVGSAHNDTLIGNGGANVINGAGGADVLDGGAGNDTASYTGSDAGVTVNLGTGTASGGYAEGDTLTGFENLIGSSHDDTLIGNGGANALNGAAGADTLNGAGGSDTASYTGSNAGVTVNLGTGTATGGYAEGDTLISIESLVGSSHNDTLIGNNSANALNGAAGADVLDGAGGTDTASYTGSNAAVNVNLATGTASGGYAQGDTLISIENLVGSAFDDILIGNDLPNALNGGAGADVLNGAGSVDTSSYTGSNAGVTVNLATGTASGGYAQGDTLTSIENLVGSAHDDTLIGNGGANALNGSAGADALDGGGGTDTASYTGSNAGVTVSLTTGMGSGGYAEGDTLTSIENLYGSSHADTLIGDGGANGLTGGVGADALDGGGGTDTASYAASGAAVTVSLATGTGSGGDAAGDTLDNIENLYGSAHNDTLTGNGASNVLFGVGGNDTLNGEGGNDTLIGGAGADALNGGSGTDTAAYVGSSAGVTVNLATGTASGGDAAGDTFSSIENLTGSSHADTLIGNASANVFNGGLGNDTFTGGAGGDTFFFNSALNAATNVDTITDFETADTISLENAIFTAFTTTGVLSANAFFSAAGANAAQDASDRIIYDTTSGGLYYDADGASGAAAIQFAILTSSPTGVTNNDFILV